MPYHDLRFDSGEGLERQELAERILSGEVFVFRDALQAFDLYDMWRQASLRGIAKSVGQDAADRAAKEGFHRIHEWVDAADLPQMTDAVYDEIESLASQFLDRFMSGAFPGIKGFYYESKPNVRFHIPFDLAQAHKKAFNEFAKDHGQGKIAAHGPHRDSWLDCPTNGINLWFAMGPIKSGNGLTIYPDDYHGGFKFQPSGDIADGQKLNKPWTFDLNPGDVIMFHTDHVHGSELNRTDETRFAISCRLSIDKPHFPRLHHHVYLDSRWVTSPVLKGIAQLPAMVQPSYVRSLVQRVRNKLSPARNGGTSDSPPSESIGVKVDGKFEVSLDELPVGTIRGVSPAICVARLSETEIVALTRRCPHAGGDLANGWTDGVNVMCPWHNLPFDPVSGASPCKSLPKLKRVVCEVRDGRVVIDPKSVLNGDTPPSTREASFA